MPQKSGILRVVQTLAISMLTAVLFLAGSECKSEEFKLGVLLCLSGKCHEWGDNVLKGIRLATSEINKNGGILGRKVVLMVQDTKEASGGATAVTAYRFLRSQGIHYFIGPSWTPAGLALAPVLKADRGVLAISPSVGVEEYNLASANIFNIWPPDAIATKFLAQFAYSQGWERGAVFSSQQPWEKTQGNVFEKEFTRLGGEIVEKREPIPTITDLREEALRIKSKNPDFVFFSNLSQMAIAARRLRELQYHGRFVAVLMDSTRIRTAKGALENTIFAKYPDPSTEFVQKYKRVYGAMPGICADTGYDVVYLLATAVKKTGNYNVRAVQRELLRTKFNGASGTIEFDSHGGVKKQPILYVVKDNSMVPYKQEAKRGIDRSN